MLKKLQFVILCIAGMLLFSHVDSCHAKMRKFLSCKQTTKMQVIDFAVSGEQRDIYFLLKGGEVHVFNEKCKFIRKINVEPNITAISLSFLGDQLVALDKTSGQYSVYELRKQFGLGLDNRLVIGSPDAKVTITVFSDYSCPHCKQLYKVLSGIVAEKPSVNLVFANFVLDNTPHGREPSLAAMAAGLQGKYFQYHDYLMNFPVPINYRVLINVAKKLGLDVAKFKVDMASKQLNAALDAQIAEARAAEVNGTPTVYVNGIKLKHRSKQNILKWIEIMLKGNR